MPIGWQKTAHNLIGGLRDLALTVLVLGGAQVLLSLPLWLVLFRSQPLGFSMALSLVGFGSWFVAFASSVGARRMMTRRAMIRRQGPSERAAADAQKTAPPWVARFQEPIERAGCGFVLFFSSLIPLTLAFFLRLQADMQSGKTWSDIFPSIP